MFIWLKTSLKYNLLGVSTLKFIFVRLSDCPSIIRGVGQVLACADVHAGQGKNMSLSRKRRHTDMLSPSYNPTWPWSSLDFEVCKDRSRPGGTCSDSGMRDAEGYLVWNRTGKINLLIRPDRYAISNDFKCNLVA